MAGINDDIAQHVTVQDRMAAARFYLQQYSLDSRITVLLDSEDNEFNQLYSSWPTRHWVLSEGRVAEKMMPDPVDHTITLDALTLWLEKNCSAASAAR